MFDDELIVHRVEEALEALDATRDDPVDGPQLRAAARFNDATWRRFLSILRVGTVDHSIGVGGATRGRSYFLDSGRGTPREDVTEHPVWQQAFAESFSAHSLRSDAAQAAAKYADEVLDAYRSVQATRR